MTKQTKLKTDILTPVNNISFPIGSITFVRNFFEKLSLTEVFSKYKKRGRDINKLLEILLSYKLTENLSISKASSWANRPELLLEFKLKEFEERTLFRVLEIIGDNREEIMFNIQKIIFSKYDFEHTDTNLDWTSMVLHGMKCPIAKYGYSRDHRPDKKQITVGLAELRKPINIPYGLTIQPGNVNDQKHFKETYGQIKKCLKPHSLIIFDKGANSKDSLSTILANKMKYLTAKKLNLSDDKRIKSFDKRKAEVIDGEAGIYGIKYKFPSRTDYFYFSEKLKKEQLESKMRKAERKLREAKEIQKAIDSNRQVPKKFQIRNELVDISYSLQTKLKELGE